jgi:hypothetical protein
VTVIWNTSNQKETSRAILLTRQCLKDDESDNLYICYINVILKIHSEDISAGQEWSMTCNWNYSSQRMATVWVYCNIKKQNKCKVIYDSDNGLSHLELFICPLYGFRTKFEKRLCGLIFSLKCVFILILNSVVLCKMHYMANNLN